MKKKSFEKVLILFYSFFIKKPQFWERSIAFCQFHCHLREAIDASHALFALPTTLPIHEESVTPIFKAR